jgi:flagellin-like protein
MNLLDNLYLNTKFKLTKLFSDLKNEEDGVSNVVATVLLIVIVVALAALLWGFLSGWFKELFEKITGSANTIGN